MSDLSYHRLVDSMVSIFAADGNRPPVHRLATSAFLDAWSMVDSASRLRRLLPQAYDLNKAPAVRTFLDQTEPVRLLRNSVQHAEERIRDAEPFPLAGTPPLWGTLECMAPGEDETVARFASLTPGTRTFRWASSATAGCAYPKAPVDHIAITAFGVELVLTTTHATIVTLARGLEEVAPKTQPRFSFADTLIVASVAYEQADDKRGEPSDAR